MNVYGIMIHVMVQRGSESVTHLVLNERKKISVCLQDCQEISCQQRASSCLWTVPESECRREKERGRAS